MKQLTLALAVSLLSMSVWAQTVTLQFSGTNKSRNYKVIIDGTTYNSAEAVGGKSKMMTMNNLSVGAHSIAVYRADETITSANALFRDTFQLQPAYDMDILVKADGKVSFIERRNEQTAVSTGVYNASMAISSADFNRLAQSVRSKLMQSARVNALRNAFSNTANYFTTDQVARLLAYVNAEPARLDLAKAAYPRVIDSANYRELYNLFSNESLRTELDFFLRNTTITPGGSTNTSVDTSTAVNTNVQGSKDHSRGGSVTIKSSNTSKKTSAVRTAEKVEEKETVESKAVKEKPATELSANTTVYGNRKPLADRAFNQVMRRVRNQRSQQGKVNVLTSAFQNADNYYTTQQIRELVTPVKAEADRLKLTKLAFARTADSANFKSLYDLLNERYSQLELDHFVRNEGTAGVPKVKTAYAHRVAIDDADFARLDLKVRFHLRQPGTIAEIKKALSGNQYFTAQQIHEWLTLVATEEDRLALAKLAYLRVTDPATFPAVYDLFQSEASREELNQFVAANKY